MTYEEQFHNICKEIESAVLRAFPEAEKYETYRDYAWNIGEGVEVRLWAQRARFTQTVVAAAPNIEVSTSYRVNIRRFKKTWEYKDAAHVAHILNIARKKITDVQRHREEQEQARKQGQSLYAQQKIELAGVTLPAGTFATRMPDGQYLVRMTTTMSLAQIQALAATLHPRCTVSTEEVSS